MACRVESHCNACGLCVAICPVNAIHELPGRVEISAPLCTECLGYAEIPACISICPIGAISFADTMEWKPLANVNGHAAREARK